MAMATRLIETDGIEVFLDDDQSLWLVHGDDMPWLEDALDDAAARAAIRRAADVRLSADGVEYHGNFRNRGRTREANRARTRAAHQQPVVNAATHQTGGGRTVSYADVKAAARAAGLQPATVRKRMSRHGVTLAQAAVRDYVRPDGRLATNRPGVSNIPGRPESLAAASRRIGVSTAVLAWRMREHGATFEQATAVPYVRPPHTPRVTASSLARECGVSPQSVDAQLKRGKTPDEVRAYYASKAAFRTRKARAAAAGAAS